MEHLIEAAADYFVITVVGGVFVLGMILKAITAMVTSSSRERSRREIAAYIAEGTMSADQGDRLMRADVNCRSNIAA